MVGLNQNIIKNIANEISRNCQSVTSLDPDFVTYYIDLLLLNPKYNKMFMKSVTRSNLEYFVNECVAQLISGDPSINTLRVQHIVHTNYDTLENLVEKHISSIDACLQPLVEEIVESYPEVENEMEMRKLFRKISIYIIMTSGLGNPGLIVTLREGLAALESIFTLEDLAAFLILMRAEKLEQLQELVNLVSGVRLFNRDCRKGGEGITDLPFDLVDAAKGCLINLSNLLMSVMQRVNSLTAAVDDIVKIDEETGNLVLEVPAACQDVILSEDYKRIFNLLGFYRQYELIIRNLLNDVEIMKDSANVRVEKLKHILEEIHTAVKYKAAVPVVRVFPLFTELWQVWRGMQNDMYLVSTVNRLMTLLGIQGDQVKVPNDRLKDMLRGKAVISDQQRLHNKIDLEDKLFLVSMRNFVPYNESAVQFKGTKIQYLGFCAVCLGLGSLVPCNPQLGLMKVDGKRFGFCNARMALRFSQGPQRYINEGLHYIRNNPHLINLLNIVEEIYKVRHNKNLVTKVEPKTPETVYGPRVPSGRSSLPLLADGICEAIPTQRVASSVEVVKVSEKEIQTEAHPIEENFFRHYSWDLWEHKRRACQWATIVNCRTHSTQTKYSHLRSEIECQTVQMRDKGYQTKKDQSTNVSTPNTFIWGLRGIYGDGQHRMELTESVDRAQKLIPKPFSACEWPCEGPILPTSSPVGTSTTSIF